MKNSKNVIPRRETDDAMKEKEPIHPELKKKIKQDLSRKCSAWKEFRL